MWTILDPRFRIEGSRNDDPPDRRHISGTIEAEIHVDPDNEKLWIRRF